MRRHRQQTATVVLTCSTSSRSSTFLKTSCPPHTVACSVVTFFRYFVRNRSRIPCTIFSVMPALSGALAAMPQGAQWLSQFLRRTSLEDQVLARRLEQLALQPSIKRSIAIFEGAEEEYSRLLGVGLQPRDLSRLERVFKERFSALREQVGLLVRGAMLAQRVSLANLLKSALALKVEIEEQRTKVLQQKLRGGTGGVIAVPTGEPVSVSDEYNWWPFDGEYWRDELETYEVHLGSSCR